MDHIEQVRECIAKIHAYDYFVEQWNKVKHTKPLEECSQAELLKPFHDLWERLPDNLSIRRAPFSAVCDLAEEYIFNTPHPKTDDEQN